MDTLANAKRVVIKIGSALLVDADTGLLRQEWLAGLAKDIAMLRSRGTDVLVVSSGSIALGRNVLGLPQGALSVEQSQAAAAVGQIQLARAYQEVLAPLNITTAQILLTLEDSEDRRRYLNSRGTFHGLLAHGVVPIVNENDTVATDEIRFGDNDRLAAQVASMAEADLLILLSDVDGLYTANPKLDETAEHIPIIEQITSEMEMMAGGAGSESAKGGMKTKIMAARTATRAGASMVIMLGDTERPVQTLVNGAKHSLFAALGDPQLARKRWIAAMKSRGKLIVDEGAAGALQDGKSLLPAGVTGILGDFARGDLVTIETSQGRVLASGLVAYDAVEAERIAGRHSRDIEEILGYPGRAALVHRDDMVV